MSPVARGNETTDPGNTADVVNQVVFTYNSLHQITKSQQAHDGVVGGGSPNVQYGYDHGGSGTYGDNARLEKITYPDGRIVFYTFGTAGLVNDRLDRVERVRLTSGSGDVLADYEYTALGRLAQSDLGITSGQPEVRNSFHGNDSDDIYEAYDRFGRIKYTQWYRYASGNTAYLDKYDYEYDKVHNRTLRDLDSGNVSGAPSDHDHHYDYDELHRLSDFEEGNWNGSSITSKQFAQQFTLEQLGNFATFKQDDNGNGTWDLDQDRGHNEANEIDDIDSSSTHVAHDAAGNMTTIPQPGSWSSNYDLTYDAWNRLVDVDDGATDVVQFEYDGLGRRIEKRAGNDASPTTEYDYYYSTAWQVLEVHEDDDTTNPLEQYVWHTYYIDAPLVRYWDENTNNNIAEHYYAHDANFNVTAIFNDSGTVLERYDYRSFGEVVVMNASFTEISSSAIDNPYTFTGREFDPDTGLYCFRNRYYHAQLGRFIHRDPIGYADGMSLYAAYFAPDGVDPFGFFDGPGAAIGGSVGTVLGGILGGVAGGLGGTTAGAAAGTGVAPGPGTLFGGVAGGTIGVQQGATYGAGAGFLAGVAIGGYADELSDAITSGAQNLGEDISDAFSGLSDAFNDAFSPSGGGSTQPPARPLPPGMRTYSCIRTKPFDVLSSTEYDPKIDDKSKTEDRIQNLLDQLELDDETLDALEDYLFKDKTLQQSKDRRQREERRFREGEELNPDGILPEE